MCFSLKKGCSWDREGRKPWIRWTSVSRGGREIRRNGAVAVRTKGSGGVGGGAEGNVVDLMVEIVGVYGKTVPGRKTPR